MNLQDHPHLEEIELADSAESPDSIDGAIAEYPVKIEGGGRPRVYESSFLGG